MGSVQLGLSDGKNTEILRSRVLKEGMEVIIRIETEEDLKSRNPNILNPNQNMPRDMRRSL